MFPDYPTKECPYCEGTGEDPHETYSDCPRCEGTGEVEQDEQTIRDIAGEEKFEAMREPDWPS